MVRFMILFLISGLGLIMSTTKPTPDDFYDRLEERAVVVGAHSNSGFKQMRGANPMTEMLTTTSPGEVASHTVYDDYFVVSVFTTAYPVPGYGVRRVRTVGLFSSLLSFRVQA